jgi:hypothetical protein
MVALFAGDVAEAGAPPKRGGLEPSTTAPAPGPAILSLKRLAQSGSAPRCGGPPVWPGSPGKRPTHGPVPCSPRGPRRPPRTSRAGAALEIRWPLADAIGRLK